MSQKYHGRDMDRPTPTPGSVRRARERAQAGLPRDAPSLRQPQPMGANHPQGNFGALPPRPPPAAAAVPARFAQLPLWQPEAPKQTSVSRSMNTPQWPLPGPSEPISLTNLEPTQWPAARSLPEPKKPPHPIRVPPTFDPSQSRDPIPFFISRSSFPESPQESMDGYDAMSPAQNSSRRTTSSVGTIPDFPVPAVTNPPAPPRRSAALGPPPSSRRGLSTMYSTASLVSPIPEESPRSRSRGSYASSAAMPETWGTSSPMASPGDSAAFFDDSSSERSLDSTLEDFGLEDETQLVPSAIKEGGGKPEFVKMASTNDMLDPFGDGTGYMDPSTGDLTAFPLTKPTPTASLSNLSQAGELTPDAILRAYAAASLSDPLGAGPSSNNTPRRLSNLRRPPFLDIGAVRAAEERGSLTSLPDLIRRATRLASLIDKGKRPGSRLDDLSAWGSSDNTGSRDGDGSLSDMLAAFPPPVHSPRNDSRDQGSWTQSSSWPMRSNEALGSHSRSPSVQFDNGGKKPGRRCCGLPLWAAILIAIIALGIVAAAIIVPLEFFVFKNIGNRGGRGPPDQSVDNCRDFLTCLNGGINVISPGSCSCVCTNGFTGSDCGIGGSQGCTTTNLVAADRSSNINNVTLGLAIPRLIADSNTNFSVPLSGTVLLAKLNAGGLSCNAQNSLVTFEGRSTRASQRSNGVAEDGLSTNIVLFNAKEKEEEYYPILPTIILIPPRPRPTTYITTTVPPKATPTSKAPVAPPPPPMPPSRSDTTTRRSSTSTPPPPVQTTKTTRTISSNPAPPPRSSAPAPSGSAPAPSSPPPAPVGPSFVVTEDVLDFARVAVLFIAQEQNKDAAETAQTALRRFLSRAGRNQVEQQEASTISVGGENRINLVEFNVDTGQGPVGRKNIQTGA